MGEKQNHKQMQGNNKRRAIRHPRGESLGGFVWERY